MHKQRSDPKNHQSFLEDSHQFQQVTVPLIWAIRRQHEEDIRSTVSRCPDCLYKVTLLQDTLLHLALKHNKLLAFTVLLDELKRRNLDRLVLAMKDRHGNTVLHIATANKIVQIVKLLLADTTTKMAVNSKNNRGETALDIYYALTFDTNALEIEDFLLEAGAHRADPLQNVRM